MNALEKIHSVQIDIDFSPVLKRRMDNMNIKTIKIATLVLSSFIIGCASSPDKIKTAYVSPMQYKNYDCDQIASELHG